jgi:hypothetical protein
MVSGVSSSRVNLFIVEVDILILKLGPLGCLEKDGKQLPGGMALYTGRSNTSATSLQKPNRTVYVQRILWRVRLTFIPPRPS